MKVYVLTARHAEENTDNVIEVFSKPKVARKWLDRTRGITTKNKWYKTEGASGPRYIQIGKVLYTLTEYRVNDKEDKD